jgi:hypothetical protein
MKEEKMIDFIKSIFCVHRYRFKSKGAVFNEYVCDCCKKKIYIQRKEIQP